MTGRARLGAAGLLLGALAGVLTLWLYGRTLDLSRGYPADEALYLPADGQPPGDTIFIGVISRYPSSVIYEGYQPLIDYLSSATGLYFALKLSESYDETVQQLVAGDVAAAFLGAWLYVKVRAEHGIECILQPLDQNGEPSFRSALITRDQSDITNLPSLAGRRLALPSELSFSANWLSIHELRSAGLELADLAAVGHFPHHHTVVYEVLRGNYDAGVVKSRVAQEFLDRGIRVVAESDPIPGSPIVVPAGHDPVLTEAIRSALLQVRPDDPAHARVLASWDPEFAYGFAPVADADYDVIRHMLLRRN